jgi:hypothetical protein
MQEGRGDGKGPSRVTFVLTLLRTKPRLRAEAHFGAQALNLIWYRASTAFEAVDECVTGTLRSSYERSGVCFGGFRPTKQAEEHGLQPVGLHWRGPEPCSYRIQQVNARFGIRFFPTRCPSSSEEGGLCT